MKRQAGTTHLGKTGCCDSSPSQHATAHAAATGHPIIQSFEPGESCFWDYSNGQFYAAGPELAAPHSHPIDQPAPGPRGAACRGLEDPAAVNYPPHEWAGLRITVLAGCEARPRAGD
ncbi:UBP-type zinc finger domain-containing protein [Micromonospora sp. DR5-3]|uniref:UBP-type zinc finger domain-containing protein n=1 Tax=Micromonospora sp. MP36 TaxID=2604468 RepID=UPI002102ECCF|nr:UBP-type zinc finger domain-containing protein [Micromonospora sp. MP36]MCW3816045.1 UBP-type zinc finger domain-containing protein [Micromonospora sp. DR5-3]